MKATPKKTVQELIREREVLYKAQKELCYHLTHIDDEIREYEETGKYISHQEPDDEGRYTYMDTTKNIATWDEDCVNSYKAMLLARDILLTAIEGQ